MLSEFYLANYNYEQRCHTTLHHVYSQILQAHCVCKGIVAPPHSNMTLATIVAKIRGSVLLPVIIPFEDHLVFLRYDHLQPLHEEATGGC